VSEDNDVVLDGKEVLAEGTAFVRYRIVRLLGRGGMGAVYEATHADLKKRVALKTLPKSVAADPLVVARFVREGELASKIRHPNVVDMNDVGVENGIPYLVMEYLEGEDLGSLLDRVRPIPVQQVADILIPTCAAVGTAHEEGVIHRDLKPENIYLANVRGQLTPKLLDFGISKIAEAVSGGSDLTKTSSLLGTPYYMSPEQVRAAKRIDHRSDQYSLGVILYECTTGRRPFEEDNLYNLLLSIVNDDIIPPRQHRPDLPVELEAIIMRAISREAKDRFASTYHLGYALLPFASTAIRAQWEPTLASITSQPLSMPDVTMTQNPPSSGRPPISAMQDTQRMSTPSSSVEGLASSPGFSQPPPPPNRIPIYLGGGVAAVAVVALAVIVGRGTAHRDTPATQPAQSQTSSAASVPASVAPSASSAVPVSMEKTAKLTVKLPDGFTLRVNNEPTKVEDGKVTLAGPVRSLFYVTVYKPSGDPLVTEEVRMAEGFVVPAEFDFTKGVPAAGGSKLPAPAKPPGVETPKPTGGGEKPPEKPAPAGDRKWDG
jgi:serine/threonine protein kinase